MLSHYAPLALGRLVLTHSLTRGGTDVIRTDYRKLTFGQKLHYEVKYHGQVISVRPPQFGVRVGFDNH